MAHWRSVLPADRFLEIQYEELVADREPLTRKMIEFCSLDWNEACLHSERNPRAVRTASVWQARQPVYKTSVARWRHYEPWLGPLRALLSDEDHAIAAEGASRDHDWPFRATTAAVDDVVADDELRNEAPQ